MALLTVENLKLGYEGKIVAEGLNFTVNSGDYLCIIGENGSGKSTLMKAILRLNQPISGKIETGEGLKPSQIGYLPQQTEVQRDFPASVLEIVLSGNLGHSGLRPFYTAAQKTAARKNIERMGISNLTKSCYRELSGGQQQRVLLARALCATTKMLLLDEPVSGLDPAVTAEMYELINKLNKDGITVIMISHDISAALKFSTHILQIGREIFFGTKNEYLESKESGFFSSEGGEEYT